MVKLYEFQKKILDATEERNRVAYYLDMGLGKTFVGAEKAVQLGKPVLCVCQKSKVDDWVQHFKLNYPESKTKPWCVVFDLTKKIEFANFLELNTEAEILDPRIWVGVINYDILYRRPELIQLPNFTLLLDESSLICNEKSKRAKFILNKLKPASVILLSGTPTNGKYELLWSQMHLLGWPISKELYWSQYIDTEYIDNQGFPIRVVRGYRNVERLKDKMRQYGCIFLKTSEVFDLPEQLHQSIYVNPSVEYARFQKNKIARIQGRELVGDNVLTMALYSRQICGAYCNGKLDAFTDLLESTSDRFLCFYNFNCELEELKSRCHDVGRPVSVVNGTEKNLDAYENKSNSVALIQYQAGSMGLNLQKANRIIYYTLPWGKGSCGNFEQSKKRIHRIGQKKTCYYYYLLCKGTIEEQNFEALKEGRELTDELFREAK